MLYFFAQITQPVALNLATLQKFLSGAFAVAGAAVGKDYLDYVKFKKLTPTAKYDWGLAAQHLLVGAAVGGFVAIGFNVSA